MKTGGPAFPALNFVVPKDLSDEGVRRLSETQGMSLRDYYSGKAMEGMLANPNWDRAQQGDPKRLARSVRLYADAMLAELEK